MVDVYTLESNNITNTLSNKIYSFPLGIKNTVTYENYVKMQTEEKFLGQISMKLTNFTE